MKFRILGTFLFTLAASAGLQACAPNPADDVPAAVVEEPAAVDMATVAPMETATEAAMPAANIPVGEFPLSGKVFATASKVSRSHQIDFKTWTGSFTSDGTPDGSSLTFTVDAASMVADEDNRDMMTEKFETHMKSPDFFDVVQFPQATFASTSITEGVDPSFTNAEGATHTISGQLTLRDVTKDVTFPATVMMNADGTFSAKAEFAVNRKDFNMVFPGAPDDLIRDEVVITADLMSAAAAN